MSQHAAPDLTVAVIDLAAADDVEPKVKAATAAASTAAGIVLPVVLWALSTYLFAGADVPIPVQAFVGTVVTGALTFVAGYLARHVDRAQPTP